MSIQDWAALAEIIGAVAVVASLIYLAVQVRQNTHQLSMSLKSTELAAFERNVESGIRIRELFILNPEVRKVSALLFQPIAQLKYWPTLLNLGKQFAAGWASKYKKQPQPY